MTKEEIKALVREKMATKRIILFGAGVVAEEFYEAHKDKLNISHCVSNIQKEWGEGAFMEGELDVRQYRPEDIEENDYIVVCGPLAFRTLELQLRDDGYEMYEDFVESKIAGAIYSGKKIALFYGQCILRDIYECAIQVEGFNTEYESIFTQTVKGQTIVINRLVYYLKELCDLYIHTPKVLDRDSAYVVNEEELPEDCLKVSIGNLLAPIYWPQINIDQMTYNEWYTFAYNSRRTLDYYHTMYRREDLNINRMISEGYATREIVNCLSAEDYYTEEEVKNNLRFTLKSLKIAERGIDIKITDLIKEKYKSEMLYQNFLHPNKDIIWYYVRGIIEKIGISSDEVIELERNSNKHIHEGGDVPIYPSVVKHLNLEFCDENYKYDVLTGRGIECMTFREYIEHYIEYTKKAMEIFKMW